MSFFRLPVKALRRRRLTISTSPNTPTQCISKQRTIIKNYYKDLIENSLTISTPDAQFNEGYLWALVATDQFFVHTPGLGKSLTAGYATSDKGWWGGHEISGRPGYGWYFGRDAIWSAFALLDYGDFEKVKDILINFQKYQDLNGKIYHELSTSGFVHYDAADATPLYLILMGRYLEHSGDTEFIQQSWPSIQMALEYCFSTDTDADHLIENTDVGHGWVEGGHLFGSHTSLHLASLWAEALHQSSLMAHALEKEDLAENYEFEAELVKEIIKTKFWNEEQGYLYQGLLKDGNFLEEFTIMPCIPIYFGQLDSAKIYPQLHAYAANAFSSDWGVRIVSAESPRFNPKGYHTGSVWPLFTGWTALAEYKAGKPVQGFTHIMNNSLVYKEWGMGYVEEVLNGEVYLPSGVCAHQCWSETMVLQPVVEGLIGFKPNAPDESFTLAPSFPYHWGDVKIKNLKLANKRVDFEMMKNQGAAVYTFKPEFNNPVKVNFQPLFPHGTLIAHVLLDGKKINPKIKKLKEGIRLIINFELTTESRIAIATTNGIGVLPLAPEPSPGERSEGFRIIDDFLSGNEYHIILEGPSGSRQSFKLLNGFDRIDHIQNAHHIGKEGNIHEIAVDFEDAAKPYVQKEVIISVK
ncbi:MAG: hypothetical protein K9H15_15760 [Bacteroidales bacterium]|nr:hypothetical protein [Bacteroidales bacterium]MCF8352625.1 hypothetical protein [Bacteroidales bacterium]